MGGPFIAALSRSAGPFGWSSVYYPIASTYDAAVGLLDDVNTAEMALLSPEVKAGVIRVSDMTRHGDVKLLEPQTPTGTFGGVVPPTLGMVDPNIALGLKFEAGTDNRATKYLRGLPVNLYTHLGRGTFSPDPNWAAAYLTYSGAVQTKFNIITRKGGPPPILTAHPIDNVVLFLNNSSYNTSIRRAGRPFGLPRGRARAG